MSSTKSNSQPFDRESVIMAASERVLQVLTCIARQGRPVPVRELVSLTGLPQSTLYRHLQVLKKWGWVQEHANSGLYEPGPLAVQLAHGFDQHSWLMQAASHEIGQLVQRSGESVGLLCYLHGQVVCLDMQESQQALRCSFAKGRAHGTVRGASAKALLAFSSAELRQSLLEQNSLEHSASGEQREIFELELAAIQRQGYATSENEVDQGVWGVSAPVFAGQTQLIATLTLMAPSQRSILKQQEFISMTRAAADRISRILQF
ncbi:IclR family transcriptional regulator [Undibacterium rugosum]|uniref:IclR family transcriptional regulator n=1 Tax=Undibacterium rugosum TaxID=2762291 RepID=UPI001E3771D0|nr:IclR family transcriptional regulator [Undibacterium rugosum]